MTFGAFFRLRWYIVPSEHPNRPEAAPWLILPSMTAAERNLTMNIARQLIRDHLVDGRMQPGEEIGLKPDQALLQDATGTLSMLMLEAIGIERVRVPLTVQYVDHNLIQADSRNPEDHVYLETASRRFGIWFSRPGNGISHPVHMEAFGIPGA